MRNIILKTRITQNLLRRIEEALENEFAGMFENKSELTRAAIMLVLNHPDIFYGVKETGGSLTQEQLDTLEKNIVYAVEEVKKEISSLRRELFYFDPKNMEEMAKLREAERIVEKLLQQKSIDEIKNCGTKKELEELYAFKHWKRFSNYVLRILKEKGLLLRIEHSEGGDRLIWTQ